MSRSSHEFRYWLAMSCRFRPSSSECDSCPGGRCPLKSHDGYILARLAAAKSGRCTRRPKGLLYPIVNGPILGRSRVSYRQYRGLLEKRVLQFGRPRLDTSSIADLRMMA